MEENEKITVYSYTKVWKSEKKIYAIMNWILPAPVNPYEASCLVGCIILLGIISRMLPFLDELPFVIRYMLIPYGCTRYLLKKKLDGKNPILYFLGLMQYVLLVSGTYVERFKRHPERDIVVKCQWISARGIEERTEDESMSNYVLL